MIWSFVTVWQLYFFCYGDNKNSKYSLLLLAFVVVQEVGVRLKGTSLYGNFGQLAVAGASRDSNPDRN